MIKLLLVEDDPDMLDLTAYVLRRERYVVAEASDGAQALRRWKADRPNLVILDLGLPTLDGFEVLRQIRADGTTPILVLTGRRDAQDILRAFNLGTDDFMPKPFEFRELIARIRAVLRRANLPVEEPGEPRLQLDGFTLDPQTYEIGWHEASIRLTPTEFRILYLLATSAGKVVPASRLYTYVWGSGGGDANALRTHISHLRHKLVIETGGDVPGTISAVPAVGYVFRRAAPKTAGPTVVTVIASPEPAPVPASLTAAPAPAS